MKLLDQKTAADATRLLVFIVTTTLATSLLVILIGNITFGESRPFRAVFTDVTGVVEGDDVRVAGVKVGTVEEIELRGDRAVLTFSVAEGTPVTGATNATVRYRNLVGQRYISLTDGIGDAAELEAGATIPVERTAPALDLTVLFNGFKPLFQALSPADVNRLSYEIVQVFQGEGGTVESLLANTASLTDTLADRDEVISSLITNLDDVLTRISDRDDELSRLIINFRQLVGGLKDDREAILGSLDQISALSVETADLVDGIREPFVEDVRELRRFAGNLNEPANKAELDRAMQVLPIKLEKIGRTAIYGSYFNFFLCQFRADVSLAGQDLGTIRYPVPGTRAPERCDLG
ncbi:MCE family protein [Nocardioides perillae]|uniref:Phospholipid/cholesterol/gamma-HCH transport system substrate-binding protein n=1 Tax=Nocardioides perillae TaxID=1119534 RepID=A0A7Y9RSI0_9ACTN|nr:MlaD family protein [Nocardioides perillae]NYG53702.1 phospholipid/cholesterol/gamma-HCH transport system substrate-binding protein [Nocardioides perillae]